MEEKKYRYDAFISYRHTELDKFVAENLIKELESFKLPGSVAKKLKGKKNKIERVFRDREELPLTNNLEEPIVEALKNSEWLIVICSPRLPESVWCKKEIETFISLRGREHVLAVLIEGEPSESFPEELLYRIEEVKTAEGTIEQVKVPVEPLAADFRGENKKAVAKAMKTEKLRILAAMFGVPFDDLRQRHRERRMRRIMGASLLVGAACLLFGVYSTVTALRIKQQSEQIEAQSMQIIAQSDEILEQNEALKQKSQEIQKQNAAIIKQNDELALRQAKALAEKADTYMESGNRSAAIETAVEALTVSDGIAMPYTSRAQMVLTESLRVYDTGDVHKAQYQYEVAGRIDYVKESPDSDTLAIYDDTGTLTLFDVKNREVIEEFHGDRFDSWTETACTFLGNDRFVYVDVERQVCIYDLSVREVVQTINDSSFFRVLTDKQGKYLLVEGYGDYYDIYDAESLQHLGETPKMESATVVSSSHLFSEGIYVGGYSTKDDAGVKTNYYYFLDLNTMQILSTYNMGPRSPEDVQIRDGIAYIALAEYVEEYEDYYTHVVAYDINHGNVLWENKQQGQYPRKIQLPGDVQGLYLLSIASGSIQVIHMQTGEVVHITSLTSEVVESMGYINNNNFLMYCEDGEMLVFNKELNLCVDLSARFECKSTSNSNIIFSSYGISVLERNDNKITIYTVESGPEVVEVEEEKVLPETRNELTGEKAFEVARTYGLDRPDYIYHLYYSDDGKYCFVRYWDYSFVVYDVNEGAVLSTMDWAYPTYWCLGTDERGYTYLLGYYGCYILNEDMEAVGWIEKCRDVDIENKKVYMTYNQYSYEAPLYNLNELLQIAEDMGYTHK